MERFQDLFQTACAASKINVCLKVIWINNGFIGGFFSECSIQQVVSVGLSNDLGYWCSRNKLFMQNPRQSDRLWPQFLWTQQTLKHFFFHQGNDPLLPLLTGKRAWWDSFGFPQWKTCPYSEPWSLRSGAATPGSEGGLMVPAALRSSQDLRSEAI